MEYSKIIAVTGLPGLYELISSKTDGAIVRSLDDKSTRFVSSRIHNFSHLESIEIFTVRENVNLADIFKAMETTTEKLPDEKQPDSLKNYFQKVYPGLDFERIYSSDLKKMVKWFSILTHNKIEIVLPEAKQEQAEEEEAETPAKEIPAKAKAKKTAPAVEEPAKVTSKKEPAKAKAAKKEKDSPKKPVAKPKKEAAKGEKSEKSKPKKAAKKK